MHPHEPRSAGSGAVGRTSITSVPPAAGSRERTDSPPDPPAAVELDTSVEVRRGIGDLAAEIDRLADGPFVRPGWFEVWLRAFGSGDRTEAVALRRDGELAAAIVLLRRRGMLTSPTNWHTPAFGPVAADPEAERELARALVDRAPSVLDLSFLDPASAFAGELQAAARDAGRLLIVRPVLRSPYVPLEGTFESYEAGLSSKFRRETRRRRRSSTSSARSRSRSPTAASGVASFWTRGSPSRDRGGRSARAPRSRRVPRRMPSTATWPPGRPPTARSSWASSASAGAASRS